MRVVLVRLTPGRCDGATVGLVAGLVRAGRRVVRLPRPRLHRRRGEVGVLAVRVGRRRHGRVRIDGLDHYLGAGGGGIFRGIGAREVVGRHARLLLLVRGPKELQRHLVFARLSHAWHEPVCFRRREGVGEARLRSALAVGHYGGVGHARVVGDGIARVVPQHVPVLIEFRVEEQLHRIAHRLAVNEQLHAAARRFAGGGRGVRPVGGQGLPVHGVPAPDDGAHGDALVGGVLVAAGLQCRVPLVGPYCSHIMHLGGNGRDLAPSCGTVAPVAVREVGERRVRRAGVLPRHHGELHDAHVHRHVLAAVHLVPDGRAVAFVVQTVAVGDVVGVGEPAVLGGVAVLVVAEHLGGAQGMLGRDLVGLERQSVIGLDEAVEVLLRQLEVLVALQLVHLAGIAEQGVEGVRLAVLAAVGQIHRHRLLGGRLGQPQVQLAADELRRRAVGIVLSADLQGPALDEVVACLPGGGHVGG